MTATDKKLRNGLEDRMEPFEKATLLTQERSELRAEMVEAHKSLRSGLLGFATIAALAAGVTFSGDASKSPTLMCIISFALSQLQFLLALYTVLMLCDIKFHAAYVRHIEDKINLFDDGRLLDWENCVGMKAYPAWKYPFRSTEVLLTLFLSAVYALLVYGAYRAAFAIEQKTSAIIVMMGSRDHAAVLIYVIAAIEAVVVAALLVWSSKLGERVYSSLKKIRPT